LDRFPNGKDITGKGRRVIRALIARAALRGYVPAPQRSRARARGIPMTPNG